MTAKTTTAIMKAKDMMPILVRDNNGYYLSASRSVCQLQHRHFETWRLLLFYPQFNVEGAPKC
jgi:hypothetical protein